MSSAKPETLGNILKDYMRHARLLLGFVVLLWGLELVSWFVPIDAFGVWPRRTDGLIGIVTHPFLHAGIGHVFTNSVGLLLLGGLLVLKNQRHFYIVAAAAVLASGLGIWLVGQTGSNHIGASGLAFGLFGYLLTTGIFERTAGPVLLSIFVFLVWGGMIFGISPGQVGVSWEGHLFGFAGGVATAWRLARSARSRAKPTR